MSEKIKQDISIGKNLHRLRKQAGLSQEQVAVKLQVMGLPVSREIISQMELGRYSIRVSVLIALKQIYGVSYTAFLMRSFFRACQTAGKMQGRKAGAPVIK